MKIFLDTADMDEIKKYAHLIDGVTTNPTLMKKAGLDATEGNYQKICRLVKGPVSLECMATGTEGIVKEARELASYAKNAVVKIPITYEGLLAVKKLKKRGVKANVTLVFSVHQALLAAKAGAAYVSPFVGRLDDKGEDGMKVAEEICSVYRNYKFKTDVIVASIRSLEHIRRAALAGAGIITVPPNVLEQMMQHDLTKAGIEKFLEDYKALNKR